MIFLCVQKHLKNICTTCNKAFERLRKAELMLKPRTCSFLRKEVVYLGHIISNKGILPYQAKTQKIDNYPVPTDVTKLCQFLGLASHYRRIIPGFANFAYPLCQLLKNGVKFEWDLACQGSFNALKELLATAPVLSYAQFGPDSHFILEADASSQELGAVLAQKQEDGLVATPCRLCLSHFDSTREKLCHHRNGNISCGLGCKALSPISIYLDTDAYCSKIILHVCLCSTHLILWQSWIDGQCVFKSLI